MCSLLCSHLDDLSALWFVFFSLCWLHLLVKYRRDFLLVLVGNELRDHVQTGPRWHDFDTRTMDSQEKFQTHQVRFIHLSENSKTKAR